MPPRKINTIDQGPVEQWTVWILRRTGHDDETYSHPRLAEVKAGRLGGLVIRYNQYSQVETVIGKFVRFGDRFMKEVA